jgi:methionyl aminopeptidase
MIILKSERDLEAMRPACAVASAVLNEVAAFIQPGVTTRQVDEFAAGRIGITGEERVFGYRKYPCQICIRSMTKWCMGWPTTGSCDSATLQPDVV